MRRLIGGLAGLGLIAGTGSVIYNHHGGATVQIKGPNGQVHNVHLDFGKQHYSCPSGEEAKLNPLLVRQGRIKLTLNGVAHELHLVEQKYPGRKALKSAPTHVLVQVRADLKRGDRLAKAYSAAVKEYNATLNRDCSPSSG